jgi:hypothetical protein
MVIAMTIHVVSGLYKSRKNPIRKEGLILPLDTIKVFNGDALVLKGRIKELVVDNVLWSQHFFRIDFRQYKQLIKNLEKCCPDIMKLENERKHKKIT